MLLVVEYLEVTTESSVSSINPIKISFQHVVNLQAMSNTQSQIFDTISTTFCITKSNVMSVNLWHQCAIKMKKIMYLAKSRQAEFTFWSWKKVPELWNIATPPIVSPALGPLVHTHHVEFWGNCEVDQLLAASQVRTNVLCLDQTSFPYCLQFCRPTVDLNFGCECYLWTWLTWCKHRACCKDCPVQQPPSRSIRLKIESGIHSKSEKVQNKLRKKCGSFLCYFGSFWVILWQFWAFLGHIWATLGHLGSFLGHFVAFLDKFAESSIFLWLRWGCGTRF